MSKLDIYEKLILDWSRDANSLRDLAFNAYHAGYNDGERVGEERGKRIQREIHKRKKKS
jgi:hypothetical protein